MVVATSAAPPARGVARQSAALELARAKTGVAAATDVRRLLAARLARLCGEAREILRCVAALAGPRAGAVEAASDDPRAARRGLEEALAAQVLERDGDRLRFGHPLMAAVTEERTPPGQWRALHSRLAGAVRDPEARARHLALGASGPDADVVAALETAASRAKARGAPATAAELAERAGTLTPAGEPAKRASRLLNAADLHTLAGDYRRACVLLEGLVDALPPGPSRARALQRLAYLNTEGESNRERAERALAEAGDDDHLLAEIHLTIATNELLSAEPDVGMSEGKPGAWLRVAPAPGKSVEGRRLPIAEPLRAILLRAYQRQGPPSRGRVCEASVMSGKIAERAMRARGWDRSSSEDEWHKARADALSPIALHECRQTYASFLTAAGYSLREITEFMGHADLVTTDRYIKVLPQPAEADRSDRLNAYFRQTDQATGSTRSRALALIHRSISAGATRRSWPQGTTMMNG